MTTKITLTEKQLTKLIAEATAKAIASYEATKPAKQETSKKEEKPTEAKTKTTSKKSETSKKTLKPANNNYHIVKLCKKDLKSFKEAKANEQVKLSFPRTTKSKAHLIKVNDKMAIFVFDKTNDKIPAECIEGKKGAKHTFYTIRHKN